MEDKANLAIALRHLVRTLHEYGPKISFPSSEAQDRLALRSAGLPSDPMELLDLLRQSFRRTLLNQRYCLYIDNYYTNIDLIDKLVKNRANIPVEIKTKKLKKENI